MLPATVELIRALADRSRRRLAEREALAAEHIRLLAEYGHTPDTCPVCETCPDWLNNPPRRH